MKNDPRGTVHSALLSSALWIVRRGCDAQRAEEVEGDLLELASQLDHGQGGRRRLSLPEEAAILKEAVFAIGARPSSRLRNLVRGGSILVLASTLALIFLVIAQRSPEPPTIYWLLAFGVAAELGLWCVALTGLRHE